MESSSSRRRALDVRYVPKSRDSTSRSRRWERTARAHAFRPPWAESVPFTGRSQHSLALVGAALNRPAATAQASRSSPYASAARSTSYSVRRNSNSPSSDGAPRPRGGRRRAACPTLPGLTASSRSAPAAGTADGCGRTRPSCRARRRAAARRPPPGLGAKALDVGERRAVHVEHAVELGLRLQRVEPVDLLRRARMPETPAQSRITSGRSTGGSRSQRSPLPRIQVAFSSALSRLNVSSGHGLGARSRRREATGRRPRPLPPPAPPRAPAGCRGCRTATRARPGSLTDVKIVCLVKQVPRGDAIEFDQETKSLVREGVPLELNRFDAYARRARGPSARRARRRGDRDDDGAAAGRGGPARASALGADRCIHLSDRLFALADTLGTSRTLALAIEKEGARPRPLRPQDARLGDLAGAAEVAAFLGLPQVTSVLAFETARDTARTAARRRGRGVYELELPAALLGRAAAAGRANRRRPGRERRRPDRRLDRCRSRRRRAPERQALRPDRIADARARRPRRHA